jgi:RNA polymerase sigma-70 factor, ECF subfamily
MHITEKSSDLDLARYWCQHSGTPKAAIAWDILYKRYEEKLLSYCQYLVRNHPHDAIDVCMEVWIRADQIICRFVHNTSFPTWLRHIAHFVSRTYYKMTVVTNPKWKSPEETPHIPKNIPQISIDDQNINLDIEDISSPTQAQIVNKSILLELLDRLTVDEKDLIIRIYMDGETQREIATAINEKETTVNKRHERIKRKLKTELLTSEIDELFNISIKS